MHSQGSTFPTLGPLPGASLSPETPFVSFLYAGETGSLSATEMSWVCCALGTTGSTLNGFCLMGGTVDKAAGDKC